jgi:hypothetical protein
VIRISADQHERVFGESFDQAGLPQASFQDRQLHDLSMVR